MNIEDECNIISKYIKNNSKDNIKRLQLLKDAKIMNKNNKIKINCCLLVGFK